MQGEAVSINKLGAAALLESFSSRTFPPDFGKIDAQAKDLHRSKRRLSAGFR
jgi:hypothetical protein